MFSGHVGGEQVIESLYNQRDTRQSGVPLLFRNHVVPSHGFAHNPLNNRKNVNAS